MEQAYQNFNAGKYKQALNNLNGNPSNHDSYQPNLAICEYLANRCQQSAINCQRRLNDLLQRKFKRSQSEVQTQAIVKFNLAVLLILQGRRDVAILLLQEIYRQRDCFIEFMQSRVFLLLLELHALARNAIEALTIYRYYLFKASDQRSQPQQWVSVVWHEHGKTFAVARDELTLVSRIYANQVLMQLGVRVSQLPTFEEQKLREELLARAKRRKNAVNKYYEPNLALLCRFAQAHRQLYARNYERCLSLMNYTTMAEEVEQMPTTKIVTNIVSAFVTSNTGLVHFHYDMPAVALSYFAKAKALLTKAYTGVEDRDLHLFSLNYGSHSESISFNQGLALLSMKSKQSYAYFESLRKSSHMSRSYKFWYRMAQSALLCYHDSKTTPENKRSVLTNAHTSLNNALLALDQVKVLTSQELKNITRFAQLKQEEIEAVIMKMKSEAMRYRHSTLTLICYVSLGLGLWRRVVGVGRSLLQDKKLDSQNKMNILHYLVEAESALGKTSSQLKPYISQLEVQANEERGEVEVLYVGAEKEAVEGTDYESLYSFLVLRNNMLEGRVNDAMKCWEYIRQKQPTSLNASSCDAIAYMHRLYNFDRKFIFPYLKST